MFDRIMRAIRGNSTQYCDAFLSKEESLVSLEMPRDAGKFLAESRQHKLLNCPALASFKLRSIAVDRLLLATDCFPLEKNLTDMSTDEKQRREIDNDGTQPREIRVSRKFVGKIHSLDSTVSSFCIS